MRKPTNPEIQKWISNPDLDHLQLAKDGDLTPLANHIENGGTLHDDTRVWLAKHLRGEHPAKSSGRRRTASKRLDDYRIWRRVLAVSEELDGKLSKSFEVVAAETDLPPGTVRSAYERYKMIFEGD